MNKKLIIFLLCYIFIIIFKYFISDYTVNYKLNNYEVSIKYSDKRYYVEINKDYKYNFDIYKKRNLNRKIISDIKVINDDDFECIVPIIDGLNTNPLCYKENEYIDFNLIESEKLDEYKNKIVNDTNDNEFKYYNSLDNTEYMALWNYKGYVVMNGNSYDIVKLFDKDRYDNNLAYQIDETIYMPNYNQEHEYSELIKFNIKTLKYEKISIDNNIDYDSYVVGHIKKKLYIFDNKHSILYEINLKDGESKIIGSNEIGFVKYKNKEFVSCSKSEYKNDKIKYNKFVSIYKYKNNNGLYKTIKDNEGIIQKISNDEVIILGEYDNVLYYLLKNKVYKYVPMKNIKQVLFENELEFNNTNMIFVYNE